MSIPATILIVDDSEANRETLVELLEVPGFRLVQAADGPSALQRVAEVQPDLILLDVMMPGMDGYEVCRRLRADAGHSSVPIIMVTALDDQASRLAGIEAGADDFVTKPFNRIELRARVTTITRLNRYRRLLEAQARLRESETRFQVLAEHSDEAFWFVALHPERMTYASPAAEKIFGAPASILSDEPRLWARGIHPEDRPRVTSGYEAALAGRAARFSEEYRVVHPNGAVRWVLDSGTPIHGPEGGVVSIGGVARDITERKNAEAQMLRTQRLENIGLLAAGIAHDFNNALAPIVMASPLLRTHVGDPHGHRLLDTMDKSAQRSVALVRQLLSFAHGGRNQNQILQLRHVLSEVAELAGATFPKSIRVESHLPRGLWPVQGNPTQVHQIFLNLCVNARDAMPEGGSLSLTAANCTLGPEAAEIPDARPGDFVSIEVRDSGTGIPPEVLEHIWEPFFTTKGEGNGSGLGLYTVRNIVLQNGGFLTMTTRERQGTTFKVYLPVADGQGAAEAGPPPEPAAHGQGELVLVVDDEEAIRLMAAEILSSCGYAVVTATDGADAIAVFARRAAEIQLVLTDIQMPVLSGTALPTVLRRLHPGLPIVAMSGAAPASGPPGEEPEMGFLAKPFLAQTLLSTVRRAIDTASVPAT